MNNFDFWHYRSVRQYILWLCRIDAERDSTVDPLVHPQIARVIQVYLASIRNKGRLPEIVEEILSIYGDTLIVKSSKQGSPSWINKAIQDTNDIVSQTFS